MTWSRATAIAGSAVVTLASCRIRIVRGHREPPRNCGTMAPGAGRHDEGSSVTAIQLSPRRRRAVKGTWPRRSPERGQSDRLFLSQARRLQILAGLLRARAESRSEPCTDVAVLRPVAN